MSSFKSLNNIVGWIIFGIATIVYALSAESTGSLWDCGEFIAGAHKLQVVHPPGAPLFLLVGRMFTMVADLFSNAPEAIAYSVNLLSGICTAFAVLFIFWTTTILSKMALVGREGTPDKGESIAILGAGAVAGLSMTFATSIWFSAVEGEVYAMSTFFTAIVIWSMMKWYSLPESNKSDRWVVFAAYMAGLSIGVHLLSLLTFPALALLYYLKKYKKHDLIGTGISLVVGVGLLILVQSIIILKLPKIGANIDKSFVNDMGLPLGSGLAFFFFLIFGLIAGGIFMAHRMRNQILEKALVMFGVVMVGFSTYGTIILRAQANTPINMNDPSDAFSLVSYLNREQYGDRPLFKGPHFDANPVDMKVSDKYGVLDDKYAIIDRKIEYVYPDDKMMLFPRIGDYSRKREYRLWMNQKQGVPTTADNFNFLVKYQIKWMYWRYFLWNFSGKQNGDQGYFSWDPRDGNWISGIPAIDNRRLYNHKMMPDTIRHNKARNKYYMLPLLFGLIGLFFHFYKRPKEATVVMGLFLMTGLAIIFYSNQPPNEPRERDYVLAGSIFTFCIWIGMAVIALYKATRIGGLPKVAGAGVATALVFIAPLLMGTQNWDDHDRSAHKGARDYATNFLETCDRDAIIFTHGDNDTYPLWYAQEVEGVRTDVRVVNLSLLAVDWYIDQLRRKVNDSDPIKMSIPKNQYRGYKRNQVFMYPSFGNKPTEIKKVVKWIGEDHRATIGNRNLEYHAPTNQIYIDVDRNKALANNMIAANDTTIVERIEFKLAKESLIKDEVAMLDILANNIWDRPIYFAVTIRPEKLLGLSQYLQLEGLGLRLIPAKTAPERQFGGTLGMGRVQSDLMYDNIMTKFKWGNFDKKDLFIDRSYMPSIQSMKIGFLRLGQTLVREGKKDKAIALVDKYFEVFPHFNFAYGDHTIYMLQLYLEAGAPEKVKEPLRVLANEQTQYLAFYDHIKTKNPVKYAAFKGEDDRLRGSSSRAGSAMMSLQLANQTKDDALLQELSALFSPYINVPTQKPTNPN